LDHFAFLPLLLSRMKKLCWKVKPNDQKIQRFQSIPFCSDPTKQSNDFQNLFNECDPEKRNDCSSIFRRGEILMPGDSPIKKEKLWISHIKSPEQIKILILGHHGSATSTGNLLLQSLSGLRLTIASARSKVYGHPNKKVRARLKRRGLQIVTTESWGNLIFLQN
jgi:beta-lactamase superfamily II metal-dependent hydrolase